MSEFQEPFSDMTVVTINETPIKLSGDQQVTRESLELQADAVHKNMVEVDYETTRGTCPDDRERVGLLSGEPTVEARPSAFGGPDVYGLYMAELSGLFGDATVGSEARLKSIKHTINKNKIKSGGHVGCAANIIFNDVLGIIGQGSDEIHDEVQRKVIEAGDAFDDSVLQEVFEHARAAHQSGIYADWDEAVLQRVLGDEAGEAIEVLAPVEHDAESLVRTKKPNTTVDQTQLYHSSGKRSYVQDDAYCDKIEAALAHESHDPAHKAKVMRYAREALIKAIAGALPNPELHEIDVSKRASIA